MRGTGGERRRAREDRLWIFRGGIWTEARAGLSVWAVADVGAMGVTGASKKLRGDRAYGGGGGADGSAEEVGLVAQGLWGRRDLEKERAKVCRAVVADAVEKAWCLEGFGVCAHAAAEKGRRGRCSLERSCASSPQAGFVRAAARGQPSSHLASGGGADGRKDGREEVMQGAMEAWWKRRGEKWRRRRRGTAV